jgi:hypothetical protein
MMQVKEKSLKNFSYKITRKHAVAVWVQMIIVHVVQSALIIVDTT